MIYLRFPEDITGRIEGATILKPSFEVSITEILSRTYQPEIVKRYAEQISDFIYKKFGTSTKRETLGVIPRKKLPTM